MCYNDYLHNLDACAVWQTRNENIPQKKHSTYAIFHFKVLLKAEIVCSNMDLGAIDLSAICNSSLSVYVGTYMYVGLENTYPMLL